jgi:hypothetical protein
LEVEPYLAVTYKEPPDKTDRTKIWRLTEKETDVRIALQIYRDVARAVCDQIVLCSNDSDQVPTLAQVRQDFPNTRIGLILPAREGVHERSSGSLRAIANWARTKILDAELAKCQLPAKVPTNRAPAIRPSYW